MKHLRPLLLPLAFLMLSGPSLAEPSTPDVGAPSVLAQKGRSVPPVKDEDGEEVEMPQHDEKTMQCVAKCQEPVIKCINKCKPDNHKCQSRCAESMERCARKCGALQE